MDGALQRVLGEYPAVARPSGTPEPLGNAGGLSGSRLWRYRSGRGLLLARAWPIDGPPRHALERVHGWLFEAEPLGFVPVPVRGRDGRTLIDHAGHLWEVTPWMPGVPATDRAAEPALVRAAFGALAAFHQRLARHAARGPSPGLVARLRELEGWRHGGFDRVEAALAAGPADPLAPSVRDWLAAARARAAGVAAALRRASGVAVPLQPCLRDVRPDHFLFRDGAVSGLVDFGAMALDTVAGDLARLLAEWSLLARDARAGALAAYSAVRPLDPVETGLIEAFARSTALLGGGHWVRWHVLDGRRFHDPHAVARGLVKSLERLGGGPQGSAVDLAIM